MARGLVRGIVTSGGGGGGGGAGVTVEEVDGTPTFAGITTLRFDQADGFVVSQPGAGIARVDVTAGGGPPSFLSIAKWGW